MPQPLVLAIEPDLRQAAIVKRIVREKVLADVAVVDSREAALEAMRTMIPDVLLLSALMSPRDEDELVAHLRTLEHADHLQTHTIPQLASALGPADTPGPRGLLSAFRRKKEPEAAPSGCDPDLFAEEIRVFLQRAADKKRERANATPDAAPTDTAWRAAQPQKTAVTGAEPVAEVETLSSSSWASPFEWKPSNPSSLIPYPESLITDPESLITDPESLIADPESLIASPESVIAEPVQELAAVAAPIQDAGLGIPDSGLGIRDKRSGIRDSKLGALASWMRAENPGRTPARGGNDLRELLTGLAVPPAVVSVGYGRGCRIRRVRVPAAREPKEAESVGAVILSRRLLAEQRDRREQPPA